MELIALASLLGLSLVGQCAQFAYLRRVRAKLLKDAEEALNQAEAEAKSARKLSVDAEELLQDLVSQGAIVKIERINPEHLFLWRPR
jgi:hypothetical protein